MFFIYLFLCVNVVISILPSKDEKHILKKDKIVGTNHYCHAMVAHFYVVPKI